MPLATRPDRGRFKGGEDAGMGRRDYGRIEFPIAYRCSPCAIARALGTLSANTLISNPGGKLIFSIGSLFPTAVVLMASAVRNTQRRRHSVNSATIAVETQIQV